MVPKLSSALKSMLTTVCPDKLSCCFVIAERREIYFGLDLENSYDIRRLVCEYFCKLPH